MRNYFLLFFFFTHLMNAQYKVDSMCGAKVNLDKNGKLLARYKPEIPGGAYSIAVKLAVDFWKNCPVSKTNKLPLYITHCSMYKNGKEGYIGSKWPHNPICVNAGMVQSFAVDWRNFSGDTSIISIVRQGLDHQINHGNTPSGWEWANVPYASSEAGEIIYDGASQFDTAVSVINRGRGDGSFSIEVDKIGDMGMAYLKFYEITGETKYLNEAVKCADALAKHIRTGSGLVNRYEYTLFKLTSPWPFRVKAESGEVQEDYTSHVVDNLRLLEELIRIKNIISIPESKIKTYSDASKIVWKWLYSVQGAIKTSIWKGYFEDIPWDPINLNRVNNSPLEFARYLIKNPENDKNINTTVPSLIWWVKNTFGENGMNAINEQTGCYQPMGSHTARYASICALWYEYSGDKWFKEEAYRYFNHASYMTESDGFVKVGHSWGGEAWFSDGYTDYIRHFMEGLGAVPEWAPAGENHLLRSSSIIKNIYYGDKQINFTCFDRSSKQVFRLKKKPLSILINGKKLMEIKDAEKQGYTWQALQDGGVLRLNHSLGNEVKIFF